MKKYLVTKDFLLGELNKGFKANTEVEYDEVSKVLVKDGISYPMHNLEVVIKAKWLVPKDGQYPKLEGPLGETIEESQDRRRKERLQNNLKNPQNQLKIVKDERDVGKVVGCYSDDKNPEKFVEILNLEDPKKITPIPTKKENPKKVSTSGCISEDTQPKEFNEELGVPVSNKKKKIKVIVDDTKVVSGKNSFVIKEQPIKKEASEKMPIIQDHYDAETVLVKKYVSDNKENTLKTWSNLHWTKKEDIIKEADSNLLKELRNVEKSEKILKRIDHRLQVL